ncbi:L-seryl-tRNA(Sec) selenium transferase [Microlunatus sp. Gsoil 973]|uniref:L-seryl-tRNA(Sec) selenium transferase n=1 Tax=Microlunatus sp. Gsoil 973 TaxID=2672569 RepID=UPI0012B455AE|nr:L-seryl-tRNA(Sec) selenium transferase [Microlunatus sp. Gsoil 973]QGN32845.1 L-seryl-tRNA(Sec) selenium transferase [Microlunatus sp. Gsoil 973]
MDHRRRVPRTDRVLNDERLQAARRRLGPALVKRAVITAQQRARDGEIAPETVADAAVAALPDSAASIRPVINATGVVLHTNLGRATLSAAAVQALVRAAGPTDVEFDLADGHRAGRGRGALAALQAAVPAAGAVAVVNNGAAALVLATTALATGREVIISRGEMVEIGDGFRLPELIMSTGARLREVGTTNRTKITDYADAISPDTGCILKVHPSNFRVQGFTSSVSVADLVRLEVPVVVDIGSGLLAPDPLLPDEPDADSTLRAGATVVTASGDKLLGGPQAGLILGEKMIIERLRRHPLARALRVDKLTLAGLEATLTGPETPTWQALRTDAEVLQARASAVADGVADLVDVSVVPSDGAVGGGGGAGVALPGWAVALPVDFASRLRRADPPVVGRVERDRCLLDLRCVPAESDQVIIDVIRVAAAPADMGR